MGEPKAEGEEVPEEEDGHGGTGGGAGGFWGGDLVSEGVLVGGEVGGGGGVEGGGESGRGGEFRRGGESGRWEQGVGEEVEELKELVDFNKMRSNGMKFWSRGAANGTCHRSLSDIGPCVEMKPLI